MLDSNHDQSLGNEHQQRDHEAHEFRGWLTNLLRESQRQAKKLPKRTPEGEAALRTADSVWNLLDLAGAFDKRGEPFTLATATAYARSHPSEGGPMRVRQGGCVRHLHTPYLEMVGVVQSRLKGGRG